MHGIVTGKNQDGGDFHHDTDVEITERTGKFSIADGSVNNLDPEETYKISFDDGTEIQIEVTEVILNETKSCIVEFTII